MDKHREIKSYVLRQGRMTTAQHQAMDELWPSYGLDFPFNDPRQFSIPLNLTQSFSHAEHPLMLEIGFGMGDSLIEMALMHPQNNYIGIEVHTPGIGRILQGIEDNKLSNLRIFHADALKVLKQHIGNQTLDAVYLFFPDPWQKKRHHKRRIVKAEFLELLTLKLKANGLFHMATDWENYAESMQLVMAEFNREKTVFDQVQENIHHRPSWRPKTKFEQKGLNKGHQIWDLVYRFTPI